MPARQPVGRSDLLVPRLGVSAMTWGEAYGLATLASGNEVESSCR